MKYTINDWIEQAVNAEPSNWVVLTFRCDGYVLNGHGKKQSVWGNGATCLREKVTKALDWTVTEFKRKHGRRLKFVSYLGGEQSADVFPHIHALLELPEEIDEVQLQETLSILWNKKLFKTLNATIQSSVHVEKLKSSKRYLSYCARFEGITFKLGDEKVLINKSFTL
jgi:hypothetical protein